MRRQRIPVLATLLLALVLTACGGKSEGELLASAKDYLDKRDAKAAVIQLKNLLEKNPSSAEGRFLLGQALLENGDAAGAEAELRRAVDLKYPEAQVVPLRARALLAQGQLRKLTDELGSIDLKDPTLDIELQTTLATAYAMQGAADEARTAVDKALAISPHYGPAVVLDARLKAAGGDIEGALKVIDVLLAKAANNTDALQFKAEMLWHAKRDRAGAAELYRKALLVRNDLPEVHAALISLALLQRDVEAAGRQLDALKKIRPNHPQTRFLDAQLAFARMDFKRAQDLIQPVLQSAPNSVRTLQFAGAVELQLGSLQQAEALLSRAVQLAPNALEARRLLADTYLRSRQPEKTLATLKPMLDSPSVAAPVLALAAQAYLQNGDDKMAQALFAKAAKLKPDDKRLSAAVALSQLNKGDADAAFGELQRLAASDDGRAVDLALISARLQRKEFEAALKAIESLEKKQPDSPVGPGLRGRVWLAKQDLAAARAAFDQALAKDAKYLPAAAGLASIDMLQKQPEAAQGRFQAILKLDPKNIPALLALAELKTRNGAPTADIAKLFADAVAANPSDVQARVAQIDFLAGTRDNKAMLSAAQAALATVPDNVELLDRLGRAQLGTDDRQQALSTYGKLVSLRPDAAVGYLGLATAQLAGKDLEAATRDVRRALEREPDSLMAHKMAIALAWQQKKPLDAIAAARRLQERRPDDGTGFVSEGEIEASQKHWDAAITAFRKALTKTDASVAASRLHLTFISAQRVGEANKFADSWLKDHPDDSKFLFYLGDVAIGSNDLPLAETRYLEVLKRHPDNALALNNVAWLQLRQKKPGALAYAERAVKAAPGQPALMDTLAMVLASEKQFPRALEVQKKVVAQMAQVPGFRLNLAKIYLESGDKKSARTELEQLAKLGKEFAGQDEVARLLKQANAS
ncbi:XrtA/PEP-CTERM system TPR-repeat protein PrsT [Aquabacterium sp.]|uniref:XrtA/PEP-CTERM system TPR-repeat protein PrsT n=1 Tax=Aquabacterium sp. TaxID=1872578 RepID=UPI002C86AB18|nr:XrtA/PEP-CTERM system TPR-repeat protein PrsT [Aquabacterium sp.]HSW04890.1 XrtA/PEP-CTERM system TPR-repeat protein PrsT [Aquabacterium sp.]